MVGMGSFILRSRLQDLYTSSRRNAGSLLAFGWSFYEQV